MNEDHRAERLESEDECLQDIKLLAGVFDAVVVVLQQASENSTEYWVPHIPQFLSAIDGFQERCREEIHRFGHWREDGREPEDVVDMLHDHYERLQEWLLRMICPNAIQIVKS